MNLSSKVNKLEYDGVYLLFVGSTKMLNEFMLDLLDIGIAASEGTDWLYKG